MGTPLITIYVRHTPGCKYDGDEFTKRCDCRKHLRWSHNGTQHRRQAGTRSWAEAEKAKRQIEDSYASGSEPTPVKIERAVTIKDATNAWIQFRAKTRPNRDDSKPDLMARKLVAWANKHRYLFLKDITPERVMKFRDSLPFRTEDSSSLKVHWSVISGFFGWSEFTYGIPSPMPSTKGGANPQFKIQFRQRKVKVAKAEDVDRVLGACSGKVYLCASLMRYSGMALADALQFGEGSRLQDKNLLTGQRRKTEEHFRVRIPAALAANLTPGMFSEGAVYYRKHLTTAIKTAKVSMTPHGFRHYRVSEWRAAGVSFEDIAEFVGTSPVMLRRTYSHLLTKGEQRLDEVQRRADAGLPSGYLRDIDARTRVP